MQMKAPRPHPCRGSLGGSHNSLSKTQDDLLCPGELSSQFPDFLHVFFFLFLNLPFGPGFYIHWLKNRQAAPPST